MPPRGALAAAVGTPAAVAVVWVLGGVISFCGALSLAYPRIYFAMADAGLLFAPLARVHQRFRTPYVAVMAQAVVALACVWSRNFEQLAAAFVLGVWPFLALAVAGVPVLRRTRESPRTEPTYGSAGAAADADGSL